MDHPSSSQDPVPFEDLQNLNINGSIASNGINFHETLIKKEDALEAVRLGLKGLKPRKYAENKLKLKFDYRGEKRAVMVHRPVQLSSIEEYIKKTFVKDLAIYYKPEGNSVIICIRTQNDLDNAVKIIDRKELTSLHLLLSQQQTLGDSNWSSLQPNAAGTYSANIVEIPYSQTCSSCSAAMNSQAHSATNTSLDHSASQIDYDDLFPMKAPSQWKKGKEIGKGAYGSVYVAHDVDTGRDLAVKIVPLIPLNREMGSQSKSLEHDIRVLAQLRHPRIIQYLGVQNTSETILIFMEYMPGGSVKDLIVIEGHLSKNVSLRYTYQILQGLSYLHGKDIIHRDIKPPNILRDTNGTIKIGDFGSGKQIQTISAQSQKEGFNGTVLYFAPEVITGQSVIGKKADVWSVGITLLEMVTGSAPWYGLDSLVAMQKIGYEDTPLDSSLDEVVLSLVRRLLTRSPHDRPTADDVLANYPALR